MIDGFSELHSPVTQDKVRELQNNADILVHVESFDLANKLLVRYSISTKIMDYLCVGRAILAICPSDIASIDYLKSNDAALVATSKKEIDEIVSMVEDNPEIIKDYSRKGVSFARTQMNSDEMKQALYSDLAQIIDGHKKKDI